VLRFKLIAINHGSFPLVSVRWFVIVFFASLSNSELERSEV